MILVTQLARAESDWDYRNADPDWEDASWLDEEHWISGPFDSIESSSAAPESAMEWVADRAGTRARGGVSAHGFSYLPEVGEGIRAQDSGALAGGAIEISHDRGLDSWFLRSQLRVVNGVTEFEATGALGRINDRTSHLRGDWETNWGITAYRPGWPAGAALRAYSGIGATAWRQRIGLDGNLATHSSDYAWLSLPIGIRLENVPVHDWVPELTFAFDASFRQPFLASVRERYSEVAGNLNDVTLRLDPRPAYRVQGALEYRFSRAAELVLTPWIELESQRRSATGSAGGGGALVGAGGTGLMVANPASRTERAGADIQLSLRF